MKGVIFCSLGLMILLSVLSCDAKGMQSFIAQEDKRYHIGRPKPSFCPQKTTSGQCCSIPFTYRGVRYNSCTNAFHNRLWCSLDSLYRGRWGNCLTTPPVCRQKTTSGQCCSIPFTYRGVRYNSCTNAYHNRPWCSLDSLYRGRWGNCVTTPPVCRQKTTSGQCCSIPFTYRGVRYNSCTNAYHNRLWCSLDSLYRGRWGNCDCGLVGGFRIRKEFTSMTNEERERYIRAVKEASTNPVYKTDYENLLATHRTLFSGDIHQKKHFLTWHRWFTLQYENLLRRVDCSITVPYWDWSSSKPFDTSDKGVWNNKDYGFGGDGTGASSCVQTGPFRETVWNILPASNDPEISNKNCLARKFGGTPNEKDVQDLLSKPAAEFTDFEFTLRDVLHFNVHKGVGGTMFTTNSAAAPEFFLVHAFVDKIWNDWQKKSYAHKNAFFPTVTEPLPNSNNIKPIQVIDLTSLPGGVRVQYQSNAVKRRRGQSLIEKPRIPRELDPEIIKLFNVSSAEVKKAKEMGELVQQMLHIPRELDPKIIKLFNVSSAEVEKAKEMGELVKQMSHIPRELDEKAEEKKELIERGNNAYRYKK